MRNKENNSSLKINSNKEKRLRIKDLCLEL